MHKSKSEEKEIYKELVDLSRIGYDSDNIISKVGKYIDHPSKKVRAKVLWMLGELGLRFPQKIAPYIYKIVNNITCLESKIRERAVGALGRIGRGDF